MEALPKSYFELWPALGCSAFSQPHRGALKNLLRRRSEQFQVSFDRLHSQPEQGISAARWLRMGCFRQRQVRAARQLGHVLCSTEYAHAGWCYHHKRRAAAVFFSWNSTATT